MAAAYRAGGGRGKNRIYVAFSGRLGATLKAGNKHKSIAMMMRTDFEISGYKQMNVKEFEPVAVRAAPVSRRQGRDGGRQNPGIGITLLGLACAAGVFAILGLLYSFG